MAKMQKNCCPPPLVLVSIFSLLVLLGISDAKLTVRITDEKNGAVCLSYDKIETKEDWMTGITITADEMPISRSQIWNGSFLIGGQSCEEEEMRNNDNDGLEKGKCDPEGKRNWQFGILPMYGSVGQDKGRETVNVATTFGTIDFVKEGCGESVVVERGEMSQTCKLGAGGNSCEKTENEEEEKISGVIRFIASGGVMNKIYSLVHAIHLASNLKASLQLPGVLDARLQNDGAGIKGRVLIDLFDLFSEESLSDAFSSNGVFLMLSEDPTPPSLVMDTYMQQKPLKFYRENKEMQEILKEKDEVVEIGVSYRCLCPNLKAENEEECCENVGEEERAKVRRTMNLLMPPDYIAVLAREAIDALRKEGVGYWGLHLRLESDWFLAKRDRKRKCFVEVTEIAPYLLSMPNASQLESVSVYIMGGFDGKTDPRLEYLSNRFNIITKDDLLPASSLQNLNFDQLGFLDALVGREADYVIGNECSTFSAYLRGWRMDNGRSDDSFFYYTSRNTTDCEWSWLGLPLYQEKEWELQFSQLPQQQ